MADHINIQAADGIWVMRAGGAVLAETKHALELSEGGYPARIYFPKDDIAMEFLDNSTRSSTCPYKGVASYYSIQTKSQLIENAGWSYEDAKEGVAQIQGHIAFDTEKVTVERV